MFAVQGESCSALAFRLRERQKSFQGYNRKKRPWIRQFHLGLLKGEKNPTTQKKHFNLKVKKKILLPILNVLNYFQMKFILYSGRVSYFMHILNLVHNKTEAELLARWWWKAFLCVKFMDPNTKCCSFVNNLFDNLVFSRKRRCLNSKCQANFCVSEQAGSIYSVSPFLSMWTAKESGSGKTLVIDEQSSSHNKKKKERKKKMFLWDICIYLLLRCTLTWMSQD